MGSFALTLDQQLFFQLTRKAQQPLRRVLPLDFIEHINDPAVFMGDVDFG